VLATCPRSAVSENGRVVAGSWQGRGRVAVGERHGMCESALKEAKTRLKTSGILHGTLFIVERQVK
jgi:hypothetical protein